MNLRLGLLPIVLFLACAGVASADPPQQAKGEDEIKLTPAEQLIFELTNKAREENHLPTLRVNAILTQVARAHSLNMAKQHKMEHILDGKKPNERVTDAGYDYRATAENIAFAMGGPGVRDIFTGWMNSPGHRQNILSKHVKEIGVGIARDSKGATYYTQEFGARRH